MKYLVDTNAWLGFFEGRKNFGRLARETMESNPSSCWISVVTVWEAAIKRGLGKLKIDYDLQRDLPRLIEENGFHYFGVDLADAAGVQHIETVHRDPFDRMLVSQARRMHCAILSSDKVFTEYGIQQIWD